MLGIGSCLINESMKTDCSGSFQTTSRWELRLDVQYAFFYKRRYKSAQERNSLKATTSFGSWVSARLPLKSSSLSLLIFICFFYFSCIAKDCAVDCEGITSPNYPSTPPPKLNTGLEPVVVHAVGHKGTHAAQTETSRSGNAFANEGSTIAVTTFRLLGFRLSIKSLPLRRAGRPGTGGRTCTLRRSRHRPRHPGDGGFHLHGRCRACRSWCRAPRWPVLR